MAIKDKIKPDDSIMVCPRCGSTNVATDFSNPLVWAYGIPSNYKCNECRNIGKFFPQIDKDKVEEYQSELKKELSK